MMLYKYLIVAVMLSGTTAFTGCGSDSFGNGTTTESTTDEGTTDEGTTDEGTTDEGTTDEGTTDEGSTDEGATTGATAEECAIACTVFKECVGEETEGECEANCTEQSDSPQAQVLFACTGENGADTTCGAFLTCVSKAITPPDLFKVFNGSCEAICNHVTGCDSDKNGAECLNTCDNKLDQDWHNLNIDCIKNSTYCGEYLGCMSAGGK
jgi:hypothetical protein